jgi:hypothetical protein
LPRGLVRYGAMDWILDNRTECWSVLTTLTMRNYVALVREAHANQGGIAGQRDVLKTTTAKRIRERMVSDIRAGALLPPVVIGAVISQVEFEKLPQTPRKRSMRNVIWH